MIESLEFKNFRMLKDATLPLGRVTVLLGPNGSGKSTVLEAIAALGSWGDVDFNQVVSVDERGNPEARIRVAANCGKGNTAYSEWSKGSGARNITDEFAFGLKVFSLDKAEIARPVPLIEAPIPGQRGEGLAMVLTVLQDQHPERFDQVNRDLSHWLPDFDRVLFRTLPGKRGPEREFMLRTKVGKHAISASSLSEGTLFALAMLTLAHTPEPPLLIGLEEPDRGIHPRLLRDVQDAIYRLAYPENFGEDRKPVQVILTTHSPYMVDLFRDHPEEIVICRKDGLYATFERLTDQAHIDEIIRGTSLGEAWYSGVLGGVPAES